MRDPVSYFFLKLNYEKQSLLFKRLLYLYVIAKCVLWLVDYDLFFGPASVVTRTGYQLGFFKQLAFLFYSSYPHLSYSGIVLSFGISVFGVFNKRIYFLTDFVLWFLVLNLSNCIYPTLTGGDFLLNQLLIYNCVLSGDFKNRNTVGHQFRVVLHNFAVLAILIQVCFLYFASGLTKVLDNTWAEGGAIAAISEVRHYNLFHPISFSSNNWFGVFLNYLVMFYQLLFPVLIWFRKSKKVLLVLGVLIHLYIAFVMGLVSFGLIMLIPYAFFWPQEKQAPSAG